MLPSNISFPLCHLISHLLVLVDTAFWMLPTKQELCQLSLYPNLPPCIHPHLLTLGNYREITVLLKWNKKELKWCQVRPSLIKSILFMVSGFIQRNYCWILWSYWSLEVNCQMFFAVEAQLAKWCQWPFCFLQQPYFKWPAQLCVCGVWGRGERWQGGCG